MKLIFITAISLVINISIMGQDKDLGKIRFINAFTRYMEWPDKSSEGLFNIGVYGSFDLYKIISEETMGRTVGKQNVVVSNLYNENQLYLTNLHILFIGEKYCTESFIKKIHNKFKGSYTLIIAEKEGIKYGAGIEFASKGPNLFFNYNINNIRQQGILISKQLTAMGQEVNL